FTRRPVAAAGRFDGDAEGSVVDQGAGGVDVVGGVAAVGYGKDAAVVALVVDEQPELVLLCGVQGRQVLHDEGAVLAVVADDDEAAGVGRGFVAGELHGGESGFLPRFLHRLPQREVAGGKEEDDQQGHGGPGRPQQPAQGG